MNEGEVWKLLVGISHFDNRGTPDETVLAWHRIVGHLDLAEAEAAVDIFFSTPDHGYLMPADLIRITKHTPRNNLQDQRADVRSAKARRLIERDWPDGQELPPHIARRLADLRGGEAADRLVIQERADAAIESSGRLGVSLKAVPRG